MRSLKGAKNISYNAQMENWKLRLKLDIFSYPPENTVSNAMLMFPFGNNANASILSRSRNNPICWGFQANGKFQAHWQRLFTEVNNNIHNGEYVLLFERKDLANPRVYSGRITHIEQNINFGNAFMANPDERDKWHHIYFLVDVKLQNNDKSFSVVNWV